MSIEPRTFLRTLFEAAVDAADPARVLPGRLPDRPSGRTIVIGAGKAAARMARVFDDNWEGRLEGLVVTRYGHGESCARIAVREAGHPHPDAAGREATERILHSIGGLSEEDLVVCLLSGGGSALLELPRPGFTLEDVQAVGRALLRSGASISEINCVRKHLSSVKGGQLAAAAHPARVVTYVISDVPGDDPSTIASGPTVPDPTTFSDAVEVMERYGIDEPTHVLDQLRADAAVNPGEGGDTRAETPKPGDPSFSRDEVVVVAAARGSIDAAARVAEIAGVDPVILGYDLEGEARELGRAHAELALIRAEGASLSRAPCVLLSGGETTVTVTGSGRGGRNTEYLLGLAVGLRGRPGVSAVAADTDGIDGTEDNAGAFLFPDTPVRAAAAGLDLADVLMTNDAYGYFESIGDLLHTGPTRTNVNDLRAILIQPQ